MQAQLDQQQPEVQAQQRNKKKITIHDFTCVVPFEQVKDVFIYSLGKKDGKKKYNEFMKWMLGQTCAYNGCYVWDLERFLNNLPVID